MKPHFRLLLIICILILSGCWDKKELNELAVATGVAIDKAEDGYRVSVQTVNSSEVTSQLGTSGVIPVNVRSEFGVTMYDATRKLSLTNSKRPYGSHLQALIISQEVAKEGIAAVIDYFSRDNDFRSDFLIILTRDTEAKDILKMQTVTEKIPMKAILSMLEISADITGSTHIMDMRDFLNIIALPGRSPIIPVIDVVGDLEVGPTKANTESTEPPATYIYNGAGILQEDKLIGYIDSEVIKSVNYLTDNITHTIENYTCSDSGKISLEILQSKTKRKAKLNEEGKPFIDVNIRSIANIGESNCSLDLLDPNSINELEKNFAEQLKTDLQTSIKMIQSEYQLDIFGFGEDIYRYHPKVWAELKDDWQEHFANLEVNIDVGVNITQLGSTKNSIQQYIQE